MNARMLRLQILQLQVVIQDISIEVAYAVGVLLVLILHICTYTTNPVGNGNVKRNVHDITNNWNIKCFFFIIKALQTILYTQT